MASVRIISATGRLKNKIDFSFSISINILYEVIFDSGMIYTTDPAMLTGIVTLSTGFGDGIKSATFTGIPNGTYYVKAYADEENSGVTVYSEAQKVFVTDKGYEIATTGLTIASPLVIAEGTEGVEKVLTSDSSGLAKWKPIKSLFTFGHYIGELYGGGIVVDVWKEAEDEKVLIASLDDLTFDYYTDSPDGGSYETRSQFQWSTSTASTTAVGPGAQSLYNGRQNTDAIIAQSITLGTVYNRNGYAGSAAQVCAEYRGGGYEDWYLPAYYELNSIYNQVAILNKILGDDNIFSQMDTEARRIITHYWSSTEYSTGTGNYAYISTLGNMALLLKDTYDAYTHVGPKIRAVRKESIYTGDGLCLALDTTNIKSFNDVTFKSGQECRWVDLVNSGMTSSYSFRPSAHPTTPSGGTMVPLLTDLTTGGTSDSLAYRKMGNWGFTKINGTSTPTLYNNTGESSLVSDYFSVGVYGYLQFDTLDQSTIKSSVRATVNVYVSIDSGTPGAYILIRQITDTVGNSNNSVGGASVNISLVQFSGKTISIKITAPNAYYVDTVDKAGPSIDNLYVRSTTGGYQPTGPLYLPSESGFLRFNGTGSMTSESTSFGSYFDINAPIGNTTTVTVEMWMRMKDNYQTRMPFAWSKYSIFTGATGGLGFNTGAGDLFGISSTKVQNSRILENWAHYVFEMRSDVSYTNNKMYINGNEQVLYQIVGVEDTNERNFNGGVGRVGGRRSPDNNKLYLFRGDISVVRIYNRALTKDEIMKNYSTEKKKYEILPKLLENNLFTSIDFDNRASFSGDGTITREVVDLSGNSRNASLIISGTTIKPSVVRTNSLYNGRELVFPGEISTNPYFSWPDSDYNSAIQSLQNISVSFWIKLGINRTSEIIVKWDSSTGTVGPWGVYQSSNTTIAIRLKGQLSGASYQVDKLGTKNIGLNKWTHVCAIYDHTNLKIKTYIDSVLDIDSSAPFGFSISTGITGEICVGRYVTGINYNGLLYPFQGSIASIQIYNKPLTSGEIKNNYDADKFRFDNFNDANKFYSHELNGNPTFSISENLVLDVSGKSNDMILRSDSEGKASWVDKSYFFNRPTNYRYIGDLYGGGVIVAMWKYPSTVFNYLIMSLEDVSASTVWSNVSSTTASTTSEHNGAANTNGIIGQSSHTTSAAKLCKDYRGGGYTDWYLPSLTELNHGFNAGSVVDTVLGSDILKGSYWTSTEINSTKAYIYDFMRTVSVGSRVFGDALKNTTNKARAFRLARVNERRRPWRPDWDFDYTPIWYNPGGHIWDAGEWFRTSITIDVLPITSEQQANIDGNANIWMAPQPYVSMTFSNSISTAETVLNSGVCWSTTSTTPTIANSFTYSILTNISKVATYIIGPLVGTPVIAGSYTSNSFIYFRAFITTPSGTYYSSNSASGESIDLGWNLRSGIQSAGATYSTGTTSYAYYPTGCFTFKIAVGFYNRS